MKFIAGTQDQFNSQKSFHVVYPINRIKDKNYMISSIETEKGPGWCGSVD